VSKRVGPLAVLVVGLAVAFAWGVPAAEDRSGGHEPLTRDGGRFYRDVDGKRERIRDVSGYCLRCHGGKGSAEGAEGRGMPHRLRSLGRSHPFDIRYPDGADGYTRRRKLDARLVLSDRRITCFTCHDHARPDHGLVLSADGGGLCVACHLT
jgi:predicted CXXCH cytochrome family protein